MIAGMVAGAALTRLAIARATSLDDATSAVYLDALEDLDETLIQRACEELARLKRSDYDTALPSVGTIRERVEALARADHAAAAAAKLLPAPVAEDDEKPYFCLACRDESSNWQSLHCVGVGPDRATTPGLRAATLEIQACGRTTRHAAHDYAVRCACSEVNPVTAERRRKERQRVEEKQQARPATSRGRGWSR